MKIVILSLRGLPLSFLGCYGNSWGSTLTIDWLASEGIVFDQHFNNHVDPAQTQLSWYNGRLRFPSLSDLALPDHSTEPILLSLLQENNVPTHLVTDISLDNETRAAWNSVHDCAPSDIDGLIECANEQLSHLTTQEHWLLWLDSESLIPPWEVPPEHIDIFFGKQEEHYEPEEFEEEEYLEEEQEQNVEPLFDPTSEPLDNDVNLRRLQDTFAARLSYVDEVLSSLLTRLSELQLREDCWIIITSDGGQPFNEMGFHGPMSSPLHEEMTHVPLIICPPDILEGKRTSALTQSADVMPTLLDLFGVPIPGAVQGRSLLSLIQCDNNFHHEYICAGFVDEEEVALSLRTEDWMYFVHDSPTMEEKRECLFLKPEDRWEVNDVRQNHFEFSEELDQVLRTYVKLSREPGPLEPITLHSKDVE